MTITETLADNTQATRWNETVALGNALAHEQAAVEVLDGREVLLTVDCSYGQWAKVTEGPHGYIATFGAGETVCTIVRHSGGMKPHGLTYEEAVAVCENWRAGQERCR